MSIKLPLTTWVVIVGALTGNASADGAFNVSVSAETKEEHTERKASSDFLPLSKECLYYVFDKNIYSQKQNKRNQQNWKKKQIQKSKMAI